MYPNYQTPTLASTTSSSVHPGDALNPLNSPFSPIGTHPMNKTNSAPLDKIHGLMGCWNNNIFYPCTLKVFDNSVVLDKIRVINNVDVDEWKEMVSLLLSHNHSNWNITERTENKMILTKQIEGVMFEIVINQTSFTMAELRYEKNGLKIFIDYMLIYKFS